MTVTTHFADAIAAAEKLTAGGPTPAPSNQFFGVGPITDMTQGPEGSLAVQREFADWVTLRYRKLSDTGADLGGFTIGELARSMHRGYPADAILLDMARKIHSYFDYPKSNWMAIGLGGGHSGFTSAALHMLSAGDLDQGVYIDTPKPETEAAATGGFFRQSWAAQILEMYRLARNGDESLLHYADGEGAIPSAKVLAGKGVKIFLGVGHETTGATTYTESEVRSLLEWLAMDRENHHAVMDATSLLGAMTWDQDVRREFNERTCQFMPFQKAIGGISGYFSFVVTPQARAHIDRNMKAPSWPIPRQLKIAVPVDGGRLLSSERLTAGGPFYDPAADKMVGGIVNTYHTLAFAETTFGLERAEGMVGPVEEMTRRSVANRDFVNEWIAGNPIFDLAVTEPDRRGGAVTLIKINDPDIVDAGMHAQILARSKQLLGYEGITRVDGTYEPGLDAARYVNAFPGTPGDYRAWIGGIRPVEDIKRLLDNLYYAYLRAKIDVLERAEAN